MIKTENSLNTIQKNDYFGLDIIRIIAMFLVITVHATSIYGFYLTPNSNILDFLVGGGRYLSFACIPLFMILTGYLNANKESNYNYFKKIFSFLLEYLICSLFIMCFQMIYSKQYFSVFDVLTGLLNFTLAPYAWYVNMYIGLFLLIPFLNILYKNIKTREQKRILLFVLIFIFSIPATFRKLAWNYWNVAYPLMFYYIGVYIKEFQPKFNKFVLALIMLMAVFVETIISMYLSVLGIMVENHNNIFCVIVSVSLFLMLYDLKKEQLSNRPTFLRSVANLSLSTFLVSFIFEVINEKIFKSAGLTTFSQRLPHLLYMTPLKFVFSIMIAFVIHHLCKALMWIIKFFIDKAKIKKMQKTPV